MAKEICISTTPHETRLAILEDDLLAEIYYERENEYTLAGSIYKGRVTRVLPGMQSSFVDIGLERDAFLYVTDFLEEQEDSEEYASDGNGNGGGRREPRGRADSGDESQPQARAVEPDRSSGDRGPERNQDRGPERNQERNQERGRRPAIGAIAQQPGDGGRPARESSRERAREQAVAPLRDAAPAAQDLEEKGDDEAPEGTRRWRGRRGRRRGVRGGLPKPGARAVPGISPEVAGEAETGAAPFPIAEHGAPGGVAALRESNGAESLRGEPERERSSRGAVEGPSPEANLQAIQPRQIDGALMASGTIVLPGESLAKYGSAPADPALAPVAATATVPRAVRPVNYVAPKPSTLVELTGGWDGGAVLPGETLSRYAEPPASAAPAAAGQVASAMDEPEVALEPQLEPEVAGAAGPAPALEPQLALEPQIAPEHELAPEPQIALEPELAIEPGLVAELEAGAPEPDLIHDAITVEPNQIADDSLQPLPADGEFAASARSGETAPGEPVLHDGAPAAGFEAAPLDEAAADASPAGPAASPVDEFAPSAAPEMAAAPAEPESASSSAAAGTPEHTVEVTEAAPGDEVAAPAPAATPQPEPEEYEPGNASASYRVLRTGPSELRLPSPETEAQEPDAEVSAMPDGTLDGVQVDSGSTFAEEPAPEAALQPELVSEAVPEVGGTLASSPAAAESGTEAPRSHEPEPWPVVGHGASALQILHEDGTIDLVGANGRPPSFDGLHAEPGEDESEPFEAPGPQFEAALSHVAETQAFQPHATEFSDLVDRLQGFAPGQGLLEEETIDEEEYDFEPMHLHAHSEDSDQEDLEEETLDHSIESLARGEATYQESYVEARPAERHAAQGPGPQAFVTEEEEEEEHGFSYEEVEDGDESDEDGEAEEAAPSPRPGEPRRGEDARNRGRGRSGGRNGGRRNGAPGRGRSAQSQDLPIISELLKQGQEILVQIAKEPIAKKGARITSHIALPGRFLVFMPTVHHVGVSRKIASDEERQRLKRILISEKGESSGGFIVRTAAEGASEEDLRADLRFLISLWTEIKQRSDTAKAPALIYHDLNLIERILRDQVSSNFSTIWVDSEVEYERIIRFLSRFQPQLVRRVKLYTKETPLFEHFGIQEEISKALKSKVWLKSGGSIVINQTEALVAIDINTGKYVGKTARLEDTIVKTNLDAIPEIVRQIRLRDLGGIIVIDFIDMDERKNRNRVLAALEEELKNDRAPSKVLQFNDFGLVAITRKRVKQSLERTLSVTCETCTGTGMVKSPITVCNEIYIEMRKMQKHLDGKDVMLRVHPEVVKQLKSGNGKWINELEELVAKTIIIKSDPALHPEQFDIH